MQRSDRRGIVKVYEKKGFMAYRINDNCGITLGIPRWPVCMIKHERVIEDARMAFESTEHSAYEWSVHLAGSTVEIT